MECKGAEEGILGVGVVRNIAAPVEVRAIGVHVARSQAVGRTHAVLAVVVVEIGEGSAQTIPRPRTGATGERVSHADTKTVRSEEHARVRKHLDAALSGQGTLAELARLTVLHIAVGVGRAGNPTVSAVENRAILLRREIESDVVARLGVEFELQLRCEGDCVARECTAILAFDEADIEDVDIAELTFIILYSAEIRWIFL